MNRNIIRQIVDTKTGLMDVIIILISSFSGSIALYKEKIKSQKTLDTIRDIKGKYVTSEFITKNNFAS